MNLAAAKMKASRTRDRSLVDSSNLHDREWVHIHTKSRDIKSLEPKCLSEASFYLFEQRSCEYGELARPRVNWKKAKPEGRRAKRASR